MRCWFGDLTAESVQARVYSIPGQPRSALARWGMWAEVAYPGGRSGLMRGIGGSKSVIRGSVLGNEYFEVDIAGSRYPDGFAFAMHELLCSIESGREPHTSIAHNLETLRITLAACQSAVAGGVPVRLSAHPSQSGGR